MLPQGGLYDRESLPKQALGLFGTALGQYQEPEIVETVRDQRMRGPQGGAADLQRFSE